MFWRNLHRNLINNLWSYRMQSRHSTKTVGIPPRKTSSSIWPVKSNIGLKISAHTTCTCVPLRSGWRSTTSTSMSPEGSHCGILCLTPELWHPIKQTHMRGLHHHGCDKYQTSVHNKHGRQPCLRESWMPLIYSLMQHRKPSSKAIQICGNTSLAAVISTMWTTTLVMTCSHFFSFLSVQLTHNFLIFSVPFA